MRIGFVTGFFLSRLKILQRSAEEKAIGDQSMGNIIIEFSEKEVMRLEGILLDTDQADALNFLKEVVKPKLRARQVAALDRSKSTGIMT